MDKKKKHIAILGSTGSIGTQTIEVVDNLKDEFQIDVLTAQNKADLLIDQAAKVKPNEVVIGNEALYDKVFSALDPLGIKVWAGEKALQSVVENEELDIVVTALVGYAGLLPTISAIKQGKRIALANKETLVVAGDLINDLVLKHKASIIPVDSEHSAIFQCIVGEPHESIEKIILTASGGPFRGKKREDLASVTVKDALNHPNWDMGAKITIDSASLMNKGLEVIEAKWLFGLDPDKIDVVVHPQSIIHSMVQFDDGSIKSQMGLPDMKLPIQYALTYPERAVNNFPRYNFSSPSELTFEKPDTKTFRNLQLAFDAMKKGGNMACVLNAANEVAVQAFLEEKITFLEMSDLIEECMSEINYIQKPSLDDYIETDKASRALFNQIMQKTI